MIYLYLKQKRVITVDGNNAGIRVYRITKKNKTTLSFLHFPSSQILLIIFLKQ